MPRIYISGPMTGIADCNFPAFNAAAARLRAAGWDVDNPAEAFGGNQDVPYRECVARDIVALNECDAIYMLRGWDGPNARGSVWEHELARDGKLLMYYEHKFLENHVVYPPTTNSAQTSSSLVVEGATLPTDSAARKAIPLASGVLDYFPAALAAVAEVSYRGNQKHNPGEPLHWARGKSMDHADCILRHLTERGEVDPDDGLSHSAKLAWRALALLQEECEANGAPLPRGARFTEKKQRPCTSDNPCANYPNCSDLSRGHPNLARHP